MPKTKLKSFRDDHVKRLSRGKIRDFAASHITKDANNISALVMPSWEGLDIEEITDPLGIQRENVVAVEKDRNILRYFQKSPNSKGVVTEQKKLIDYLAETDRKFDLAILDHCSNVTFDVLEAIGLLAGRQLLAHNGVLVTNILGERERQYAGHMIWMENSIAKWVYDNKISPERIDAEITKLMDSKPDLKDGVRGDGITRLLISTLLAGRLNIGDIPLFSKSPTYERVNGQIEWLLEGLAKTSDKPEERQLFQRMHDNSKRGNYVSNPMHLLHLNHILDSMAKYGIDRDFPFFLLEYSKQGYHPRNVVRYDYVSGTGRHMFMDIIQVAAGTELFKLPRNVFDLDTGGIKVYLGGNPVDRTLSLRQAQKNRVLEAILRGSDFNAPHEVMDNRMRKEVEAAQEKCIELYRKVKDTDVVINLPQREYLGSSYNGAHPSDRSEPLERRVTKRQAYITNTISLMLFEHKFTPEEIAQLSSKYDSRHFGALKAHWMRGTYGEPLIKAVLTREAAIKLLQMGFSSELIRQKYPEWSTHEFGALKAHVTRGTYT